MTADEIRHILEQVDDPDRTDHHDALRLIAQASLNDAIRPVRKLVERKRLTVHDRFVIAAYALTGFNAAVCAVAKINNITAGDDAGRK